MWIWAWNVPRDPAGVGRQGGSKWNRALTIHTVLFRSLRDSLPNSRQRISEFSPVLDIPLVRIVEPM